jgi:glyoxylase-like metal-dependent hydrolase (beta-lactamase superfamily II)
MTSLSRRAFALGLPAASVAAGWALSARTGISQAEAAASKSRAPSAQIKIGRFTVTALVDGFADMPFEYFPGRRPEEVEEAANAVSAAKPGGIRFMFNQYLVDDGERLILIDTGPGGSMGQTGQLPTGLRSLGVTPDHIGAVILTHLHADHIGGLVVGGRRNFPNAEIYADRRDVTYWTDPANRAAAPDYLKLSFDLSAELARLYPKLQAMDGEREISRGVSIVDLTWPYARTRRGPGRGWGESLIMVSDMLFPVIHPEATDVGFLFEQDRPAATAMRDRFFPRAAEEKALLAATHMPFPGLGRIISDRRQLRWIAAEWVHQEAQS